MGESEKPFACPSPGCNMSFTNEDHLVVHKKKHDMTLNLGNNKTGVFIADQTPTPTRFIRNCEEVGLFQDLQNVNPFEETFRRAVESGKIGSLPDSEIDPHDDTLHTPHVFPQLGEEQSSGSRKLSPEITEISSKNNPACVAKICEDKQEIASSEITKNITTTTRIKKSTETIVIQEADTSVTPVVAPASNTLSINEEEVQLLLKTDDGKLMQLSAIPVCGTNSSARIASQPLQPIVVKSDIPIKCPRKREGKDDKTSRLSLAKKKLKEVLLKTDSSQEPPQKMDQNENHFSSTPSPSVPEAEGKTMDIRKKQEILARNRASSMRARAKRKMWIQQLQKSLHTANELNSSLQVEVKSLRSEVAKLKALLLAHKDCPVTKAMETGKNIVVAAQMIPVAGQFIQASVAKHPSEPLPAGNKKQSVLLQKQTIILPKITERNLPIRITKIMGNAVNMRKIDDEKAVDDSILLVQNTAPKTIQVRQVIHVD